MKLGKVGPWVLTLGMLTLSSCGGGGYEGATGSPSAPVTSVTSGPASVQLGGSAVLQFTASVPGSTFQCNLDSAGYAPCASPLVINQACGTEAIHTVLIQATSPDSVTEATPVTYSWDQENYSTVALYHFDSTLGAQSDSSLFTGSNNNSLSDFSTTATASGKFGDARVFSASAPASMSAASSTSLALLSRQMTIDTFVKFTSLPASGSYMVIAGKNGGAGSWGWDFGMVKWGPSYYLYFLGSLDGTNPVDLESNSVSITAGTWHHVAATWDQATGMVTFYMDGNQMGSSSIGATGSPLFTSSAPLRLGASASAAGSAYGSGGVLKNLDATLDDFRLSQSVRWTSNFTVPSTASSAD